MSSQTPSRLTTLILCDLPSEITESDIKSFLSSYKESIVSVNKFEQKPEKVKVSFKDFEIANKCRIDLQEETTMLEYISAPEAAKKWGISERRVQKLCEENRIPSVARFSRMWLIPKDAEKPVDGRLKISKSTDM